MKKNYSIIFTVLLSFIILLQTNGNEAISNNSGSPAGRTGSPSDNATCASSNCHAGTASSSPTQIIFSNVPATGYIPGQTYSITATVSQSGINKYGFQISPMNVNGTLLGSLSLTNPSTTKIVSSKYVTHTAAGTSGTGGKTWSFNWTAPVAGTGNVTFYGAFNFANGNTNASGDIIRTNILTISENTGTTGINTIDRNPFNAVLYPNPVINEAKIQLSLDELSSVMIQITDLTGKSITEQTHANGKPGVQEFPLAIPAGLKTGIYRAIITINDQKVVKSFFKN